VLLSVNSTVFTLDSLSSTDQLLSRGPFSYISPSPNGKSLALLTEAGLLWVLSADFQRPLADFDTKTVGAMDGEKILQVEWSGNDAILVVWESMAVLVGPFGDTLR
jgi:vacuolar protein sorting-associated protein 16